MKYLAKLNENISAKLYLDIVRVSFLPPTPTKGDVVENLVLVRGECAICHGPIDKAWAGEDPEIGTVCRTCSDKRDTLFRPEHVHLMVVKKIVFNPLFGLYEYQFNWEGTEVMINGRIGEVIEAYLGSCRVRFPEDGDNDVYGHTIQTLDYWRLKDIYEATGGEMNPPPLPYGEYVPVKVELLPKPILNVNVIRDKKGAINHIDVGNHSSSFGVIGGKSELPMLPMFHAFCNNFVRHKFGLAPNFCSEGGFYGEGFEIRNAGTFIGGVGLSVRGSWDIMDQDVKHLSDDDLRRLAVTTGLLGLMLDKAQRQPGVVKNATLDQVLSTWITVMETLLSYDWKNQPYKTIDDVWESYCRMQDILLNIMPPDELSAALTACKKGRMNHCGSSY